MENRSSNRGILEYRQDIKNVGRRNGKWKASGRRIERRDEEGRDRKGRTEWGYKNSFRTDLRITKLGTLQESRDSNFLKALAMKTDYKAKVGTTPNPVLMENIKLNHIEYGAMHL